MARDYQPPDPTKPFSRTAVSPRSFSFDANAQRPQSKVAVNPNSASAQGSVRDMWAPKVVEGGSMAGSTVNALARNSLTNRWDERGALGAPTGGLPRPTTTVAPAATAPAAADPLSLRTPGVFAETEAAVVDAGVRNRYDVFATQMGAGNADINAAGATAMAATVSAPRPLVPDNWRQESEGLRLDPRFYSFYNQQ